MNRRRLIKSTVAAGASIYVAHSFGTPLIKAQTAKYELKVIQEPELSTVNGSNAYFGAFNSLSNGVIAGNLTVSEDKASPCVWTLDGGRTKLKSGEFGGNATIATDSGLIAGVNYGVRFGDLNESYDVDERPAIWVNDEPVEITLPESALGTGRIDGMNGDGVGFGKLNVLLPEQGYESVEKVYYADNVARLPAKSEDAYAFLPHKIGPSGSMAGNLAHSLYVSVEEHVVASYSLPVLLVGGVLKELPAPADFPAPESPPYIVSTPTSVGLTVGDEAVYWFSRTIDAVTSSRLYRYVNDEPVEVKSGVPELVNLTASHVSASGVILAFGDPEDRSRGSRLVIGPDETIVVSDETVINDTPVVSYTLNGVNDDGVLLGNGYDAETRWYGIALFPV